MSPWLQHLPVLPIVLPLFTGAILLFFAESRHVIRGTIAFAATLAQAAVAAILLYMTTDAAPHVWQQGIGVYPIGGWPAPFGIVLVVDRLAALMLALNAALALPAVVYSFARWDRVGVYYHSLFQFLLMGLNGAFLTGDLFNLFVFFEVLLASSYGLVLHSGGRARVSAGLHYIVVNLVSSLVFLVGVAVIYGIAGTLNMAELGAKWQSLPDDDRALFEGGAAILGIAFLVKAGAWPLNFWLPNTYWSAGGPVAAVFSIMTKVGVYAVLRMGSLMHDPVAPAPFGGPWLFGCAIATMAFGTLGMLGARHLTRLVAFTVIVSSGTLLAALGLGSPAMTAPALFYLLCATPATAAFFLLTGMTERIRTGMPETAAAEALPPASYTAFSVGEPPEPRSPDDEVGIAIPAAMAFLGLMFVSCVLLVTGLPPLAGFVAKFALLATAIEIAAESPTPEAAWILVTMVLAGGLAGLIALSRMGILLFWTVSERTTPRLRVIEAGPVAVLVLASVALAVWAGPVMVLVDSTASALNAPHVYIDAVLATGGVAAP